MEDYGQVTVAPVIRSMMHRDICRALPCFFAATPDESNDELASAPATRPTEFIVAVVGGAEGEKGTPACVARNTKIMTKTLSAIMETCLKIFLECTLIGEVGTTINSIMQRRH